MEPNSPQIFGTSGLWKPDYEKFLYYSKIFYDKKQYSNSGPCVNELECRLAKFHETRYCITFCSGFWALVLAIDCLKLKGRAKILMPSLTYRRLADLASWSHLKPKFYDVDINTLTVDPHSFHRYLDDEIAIVLGVHPIINCFPTAKIKAICDDHEIPFMMDSVESAFERSHDGKVGSIADCEVFSMHASKFLNGSEGGYLTTNNKDLAMRLYSLRGFGFSAPETLKYSYGLNAKLNEMHAALALANLDEVEDFVAHNRKIYRAYLKNLASHSQIKILQFDETIKTSYKNIVARVEKECPLTRDQLVTELNSIGILAREYYSPPLHKKPPYASDAIILSNTEILTQNHVLLPSGYQIAEENVKYICERIVAFTQ